jgi:hypothetical protein
LVPSKCSGEVEIISPIDPPLLIIQRRREPELDRWSFLDQLDRNEEASVESQRVRGDHVDFVSGVSRLSPAGSCSSKRVAPDH